MVYNALNYWVFGLFPLSGILENRKPGISETGSVFSLLHLRMETDLVSKTSCFLFSRIPDNGESPKYSNSVSNKL
jgi:hypothetical protein